MGAREETLATTGEEIREAASPQISKRTTKSADDAESSSRTPRERPVEGKIWRTLMK